MVNALSPNPIRFRGPAEQESPSSSGAGHSTGVQKSGATQKPQSTKGQSDKDKDSFNLEAFFEQLRTKVEDFLHSVAKFLQELAEQLSAFSKRFLKPKKDAESEPSHDAEPASTPAP